MGVGVGDGIGDKKKIPERFVRSIGKMVRLNSDKNALVFKDEYALIGHRKSRNESCILANAVAVKARIEGTIVCFFDTTFRDEHQFCRGHGYGTVGDKVVSVISFELVDA